MTTIYNYRLYCETEGTYVTVWGESPPTTCPHNTAHTIVPGSISAFQSLSTDAMVVLDGTPGYYQTTTITINVPSGPIGSTHIEDISFPFDVKLWTTSLCPTSDLVGDVFNVITLPDKVISALTATGNIGDTTLSLDQAIFALQVLVKGCYLKITDGVTTQDLGRITAIDAINYTVTIENALTTSFAPGSPIMLNLYMVKDYRISQQGGTIVFGAKGFATKSISATSVVRVLYTNNTGLAKTVYMNIEYNYL